VNLLDENIPLDQGELLEGWGIRCRMIGQNLARSSIGDDNILTLLHRLKQPTFFSRDRHFFQRPLCHGGYALVWLDLVPEEAALFVRRFLAHPCFRTKALRLGVVARVHHDGIHFWQRNRQGLQRVGWLRG